MMIAGLALAAWVGQPVLAGGLQADGGDGLLHYGFGEYAAGGSGAEALDAVGMAETRGRIWALPLAIVGVDLALMSFYWGVYVPSLGGGGGSCFNCRLDIDLQ
jgi:hypothetical protein